MKKLIIILALFLYAGISFSQSPQAFNYQAVLRDVAGNIRANTNVNIRIDLIQSSATGAAVYSETFAATTNAFGLINLQVGKGTVISGTFNTIDWSAGPYFIKISVDGTEMSTSQLLSVPYALYATKASNGFSGAYNDLAGKPALSTVATSGNYNDLLNKPVFTESDPVFNISVAKSIKASDTTRWTAKSNFDGDYRNLTNKPVFTNHSSSLYALANHSFQARTTGNFLLGVGQDALVNNSSGFNNDAFGHFSLAKNSTGNNNVAIGSGSLKENVSGSYNTALGSSCLYRNSAGSYNTAIGTFALYFNTSSANVAIGYYSLINNITGYGNTAVGTQSLRSNRIGYGNTALGDSALFNSNTDRNTAVGYMALYEATAKDNTALGFLALSKNTGYENVAVGSKCMVNSTGNANTAVGFNSMVSNISGTLNTALGCYTDIANNVSNSTAVGNGAVVNASDKMVFGNGSIKSIGGFAAWTNFSDARLKENIVYSNQLGLNFITRLKPATYSYKADSYKRTRNGLIAQDVQLVLKDLGLTFSGLVADDDADRTLNLSYQEFVIPLINSVQELNARNQELQKKNESLEATVNSMKADLEALKKLVQK